MHILHRQEETTGLPLDAWGRPMAARRVLWEIPGIVKVRIVANFGDHKSAYCGIASKTAFPAKLGNAVLCRSRNYPSYPVIRRATWTPLAEAWDREWVMPLPSPMM